MVPVFRRPRMPADRIVEGREPKPEKTLGSVRRAREAIEERQRHEDQFYIPSPTSPASPPPFIQPGVSRAGRPTVQDQTLQSSPQMASQGRSGLSAIGSAILRPSQSSQFRPLAEESETGQSSASSTLNNTGSDQLNSSNEGLAAGTSRPHDQYPPFPYRPPADRDTPHYWEDDYQSPTNPNRKTNQSALFSSPTTSRTSSSMGSIPDFPVPILPQAYTNRRSSNLGPPSSRRGGSSYYSTTSNVAPIPEEANESGRGSLVSGKAIPSSWGSGHDMEHFFVEGQASADDEAHSGDEQSPIAMNDEDEKTLVRQASVTMRQRPSLTTIGSTDSRRFSDSERSEKLESKAMPSPIFAAPIKKPPAVANILSASAAAAAHPEAPMPTHLKPMTYRPKGPSLPEVREPDPQADAIMASIHRAGSSEIVAGSNFAASLSSQFPPPKGSLSNSHRSARPARLDLDNKSSTSRTNTTIFPAPGEARASLTSLPDLIKRATRLATSLDRGYRPGSKFDPLALASVNEKGVSGHHQPKNSMTDMLDSFPLTPGLSNSERGPSPLQRGYHFPRFSRGSNRIRQNQWPEKPLETSSFTSDTTVGGFRQGRRCCGIPIRIFVLLFIILILVVAAAIVIPVTLVYLPRQAAAKHSSASAGSDTDCAKTLPCANGGASIMSAESNQCSCICVAGFTGPTCTVPGATGCTDTRAGPDGPSASVGQRIPDYVKMATSTFFIPINVTQLYSKFANAKLDCQAENALLISKNSTPSKNNTKRFVPVDDELVQPAPSARSIDLFRRQAPSAITINGIVVAPSPTSLMSGASVGAFPTQSLPSSISLGDITKAPTATSAGGSAAPSTTGSLSPSTMPIKLDTVSYDFASVCVLYIFQVATPEKAQLARNRMVDYLNREKISLKLDAGNKITVDFGTSSIDFGDGKGSIGGKGPMSAT